MSRKSRKRSPAPGPPPASPGEPPAPPRWGPRAEVGVCLVLFLAVLLVFGRTAWFAFVTFDDPGVVAENPVIAKGLTPGGFLWAFTHSQISVWTPLTTLSHMLDCQLYGLWAGGHHLTNVILHALTSVLLFLVLRRMTGAFWRCALAAALFALHPLRVESVAWITERKDVLSGLFFMLTIGAYHRWAQGQRSGRWWTLVFLILGLLSKPMLVTVPVVLLLLDHWPLRRTHSTRLSRLAIEKLPLFAVSLAAAIVQLVVARDAMEAVGATSFSTRVANAVVSCATYVIQVFWPTDLAAYYPFPRQGVHLLPLMGASALLIGISAAVSRWRRQAPWLAMGWLWYLVMVSPVLGLVQAGEVARADRYTYLPHIGLYLMVVWTISAWCAGHQKRVAAGGIIAAASVTVAALLAFRQTGFWRDSETLWHRALACHPVNDTAHYNLGTSRLKEGKLDEAIAHYHKSLQANPAYVDAHINLGQALLEKGLPDAAMLHYWKALDIKPRFAEAHYNLALVYAQKGDGEKVLSHYRKALEINPAHFNSLNNLGSLLLQAGRTDDAITHYRKALRSDPSSAKAHNNLATALAQKGRIPDAISHYEKVIEIDPDHAKALNSLAWLLATTPQPAIRNGPRALAFAEHANQLTSHENPLFLRTLAAAYADSGRYQDALNTAERALHLATTQGHDSLARNLPGDIVRYKASQPTRQQEPAIDKSQSRR